MIRLRLSFFSSSSCPPPRGRSSRPPASFATEDGGGTLPVLPKRRRGHERRSARPAAETLRLLVAADAGGYDFARGRRQKKDADGDKHENDSSDG